MGYMHIDNLYKNQTILQFKKCYALEKIHGTSAHISWKNGKLTFFSGGEKHDRFVALFDVDALTQMLQGKFGPTDCTIFGEAYGGKQQGMSTTYGDQLRFVAFDVQVGEKWLAVPAAAEVAQALGLDFVDWELIDTTLTEIDRVRDLPSVQAKSNGITEEKPREGIVLRPPVEVILNNGARVIAKHKRPEFSERKTNQNINPANVEVLTKAEAIADEWVTDHRLNHVIDHIKAQRGEELEMQDIPLVISGMLEDVLREAAGEIVDSKEARKAIGAKTVKLFKASLMNRLVEQSG